MRKYQIYAAKLMNNPAKEPCLLGEVLVPNKKQALWIAYKEFSHLLPMYWKESLFAIPM